MPLAHGEHCVSRLPNAKLFTVEGESHLGGLGIAEEVISTVMALGRPSSGVQTPHASQ